MSEDPKLLTEFFARHGVRAKEEFLEQFDGAFLLGRFKNSPPYVLFIGKDPEVQVKIGSDEDDCDFDVGDPTIDPIHAIVVYHEGFRGWTVTDQGSNFGTHLDGDRIAESRSVLIPDGGKIKPGGGLTELQFYLAETLYSRMSKAGITRSLRRSKLKEERAKEEVSKQLGPGETAPESPKESAPESPKESTPESPEESAPESVEADPGADTGTVTAKGDDGSQADSDGDAGG